MFILRVNLLHPLTELPNGGSSRLRHALYMAIQSGIRDARKKKTTDEIIPRNKRLREFYDKKREEGKPFRVAVIACVNKLLHWIYALLKEQNYFPGYSLRTVFILIHQNLPKAS